MTKFLPSASHILRLEEQPIADAACEIRFSSDTPVEAFSGLLFNQYRELRGGPPLALKSLETLEIPEVVRSANPAFRYIHIYGADADDVLIKFGQHSLLIGSSIPYIGWEKFKSEIQFFIHSFYLTGIIEKVERLGIRYINFLPGIDAVNDLNYLVSDNITTDHPVDGSFQFDPGPTGFSALFRSDQYDVRLSMEPDVRKMTDEGVQLIGALVDIDAFFTASPDLDVRFENIIKHLDELHARVKSAFFAILKDSYLSKLSPETRVVP